MLQQIDIEEIWTMQKEPDNKILIIFLIAMLILLYTIHLPTGIYKGRTINSNTQLK